MEKLKENLILAIEKDDDSLFAETISKMIAQKERDEKIERNGRNEKLNQVIIDVLGKIISGNNYVNLLENFANCFLNVIEKKKLTNVEENKAMNEVLAPFLMFYGRYGIVDITQEGVSKKFSRVMFEYLKQGHEKEKGDNSASVMHLLSINELLKAISETAFKVERAAEGQTNTSDKDYYQNFFYEQVTGLITMLDEFFANKDEEKDFFKNDLLKHIGSNIKSSIYKEKINQMIMKGMKDNIVSDLMKVKICEINEDKIRCEISIDYSSEEYQTISKVSNNYYGKKIIDILHENYDTLFSMDSKYDCFENAKIEKIEEEPKTLMSNETNKRIKIVFEECENNIENSITVLKKITKDTIDNILVKKIDINAEYFNEQIKPMLREIQLINLMGDKQTQKDKSNKKKI